jgi:hypothetical protein
MDDFHVDSAEQKPFAQSVGVGGFDLPHPAASTTSEARRAVRASFMAAATILA